MKAVFLFSVAFCAYTVFGYPLLLGLLARRRARPVHKAPWRATVSVILPVHNGERWIGAKLESIQGLNYPAELVEILVVSDGSTDGTEEIVQRFASRSKLEYMAVPRRGKAAALNAALARASGEILFFTDVRQQLQPDSLANLIACFADPEVGVASGELVIREGAGLEEASVGLYWRYEKWIRKQLSRLDSVMGATGCIYAMRRQLASPLPVGTLNDDMYLPLGAFFQGYRVIFDESALAFDYPTQLASEFRRKVRTLAGVYQIIGSHLLARQRPGKPGPSVQAIGYVLALIDAWLPENFPLKRLTSPVRTFTVLMAASLCAVSILFVPARVLWKESRISAQHGKPQGPGPESGTM